MTDMTFFFSGWDPLVRIVVGIAMCVTLVIFLRISGIRTLSSMNAFDFIVTVTIGSGPDDTRRAVESVEYERGVRSLGLEFDGRPVVLGDVDLAERGRLVPLRRDLRVVPTRRRNEGLGLDDATRVRFAADRGITARVPEVARSDEETDALIDRRVREVGSKRRTDEELMDSATIYDEAEAGNGDTDEDADSPALVRAKALQAISTTRVTTTATRTAT